jgi:hypothetical protein
MPQNFLICDRGPVLAVALPGMRSPASNAFLTLLEYYAAAYPELQGPARV